MPVTRRDQRTWSKKQHLATAGGLPALPRAGGAAQLPQAFRCRNGVPNFAPAGLCHPAARGSPGGGPPGRVRVFHSRIPDAGNAVVHCVFWGRCWPAWGRRGFRSPAGVNWGPRPIDLHLRALRRLGVNIFEDHGETGMPGGKGDHRHQFVPVVPQRRGHRKYHPGFLLRERDHRFARGRPRNRKSRRFVPVPQCLWGEDCGGRKKYAANRRGRKPIGV